jgi:hypothetical protein
MFALKLLYSFSSIISFDFVWYDSNTIFLCVLWKRSREKGLRNENYSQTFKTQQQNFIQFQNWEKYKTKKLEDILKVIKFNFQIMWLSGLKECQVHFWENSPSQTETNFNSLCQWVRMSEMRVKIEDFWSCWQKSEGVDWLLKCLSVHPSITVVEKCISSTFYKNRTSFILAEYKSDCFSFFSRLSELIDE